MIPCQINNIYLYQGVLEKRYVFFFAVTYALMNVTNPPSKKKRSSVKEDGRHLSQRGAGASGKQKPRLPP